jgi:hypothetical protein
MTAIFNKHSKKFHAPPVVDGRKVFFDTVKVQPVPYVAKLNDDELKLLEQECAICQSRPEYAVRLPCGHDFCHECERKWNATCKWRLPTCPLCRADYRDTKAVSTEYTQATWAKKWHGKKGMLLAEAERVILWSQEDPIHSPCVSKSITPHFAKQILLDRKHSPFFPTIASAEGFIAAHKLEMWKERDKAWKESPWSKMKPIA